MDVRRARASTFSLSPARADGPPSVCGQTPEISRAGYPPREPPEGAARLDARPRSVSTTTAGRSSTPARESSPSSLRRLSSPLLERDCAGLLLVPLRLFDVLNMQKDAMLSSVSNAPAGRKEKSA